MDHHKAPDAFRSISEVADDLDLPQHVLRFWESRFREIKPMKRGGGRRYYRPDDVNLLRGIRHLLYGEGYTIRGVQRILREQGVKFVQAVWQEGAPQPPHGVHEDTEAVEDADLPDIDSGSEGLRDRLSSLIGRDLGDRQDDVAARHDPPFTDAPEPHIGPSQRPIHGVTEPRAAPAAGRSNLLPGEDLRKLRAALRELAECRKLIDAVVMHTDQAAE